MVTNVGIIGFSEGNGHPYSFAAIINGYNKAKFPTSEWSGILNYLEKRNQIDFGFNDVKITHAWSQQKSSTERLCAACNIKVACDNFTDMIGAVDAIIIARDDWKSHYGMAIPFLESGAYVFVDKPLTLDNLQLQAFSHFLVSKKLMSCSGFRFSTEMSQKQEQIRRLGKIKSIKGTVINDLIRYGIHLIDAVNSVDLGLGKPVQISRLATNQQTYSIMYENGTNFILDCLGTAPKTFHLSFFGSQGNLHIELEDNFGAFRSTLGYFFQLPKGLQSIKPEETIQVISMLQVMQKLDFNQNAAL